MGFDNRFPSLELFHSWRGSSRHVRNCVEEVERRTGTGAIINVDSGRIIFRYGEKLGGPFAVQMENVERWNGGDVDAAVHVIQYAKNADRYEKDKVVERQEKDEKEGEAKKLQSVCDDAKPDVLDHVAHIDKARRGVAKVISA